jgi:hypothetical protein
MNQALVQIKTTQIVIFILFLVDCQNGKDAFTWSSVNNCTKHIYLI